MSDFIIFRGVQLYTMKLLLFIFFVQFSKVRPSITEKLHEELKSQYTAITSIPIFYLNDQEPEYVWTPPTTGSIIIEADEGYKITLNVTECNIDGENGEYASVTDGRSRGLIFTYKIGGQHNYVYNTDQLYANFIGTSASNFSAVFRRVGNLLTTTTSTEMPTTISLPIPSNNDSSTLLIYLQGQSFNRYDEEQVQRLKNAVTNMAKEYCNDENFPLNGSISSSNVIIHRLNKCPLNWPIFEKCVELNISIPVNLLTDSNSIWMGYQLTTDHMRIMWDRYAPSQLPVNITYFFEPDTSNLKWGILITTTIIVVFILSMGFIRYFCANVSKSIRKRKRSDTTSIISTSDRNSRTSLPPHYLQETPPLFENAYPMYNPDKRTTYSEPSYTKSVEYFDVKKQANVEEEESGA